MTMGYTHYWSRPKRETTEAFAKLYAAALQDCRELIAATDIDLEGGIEADGGIFVNGILDAAEEDFVLPANPRDLPEHDCCTTEQKPYDRLVIACLAVMAEAGLHIESDGNAEQWRRGIDYAEQVLGRAVRNPMLVEPPAPDHPRSEDDALPPYRYLLDAGQTGYPDGTTITVGVFGVRIAAAGFLGELLDGAKPLSLRDIDDPEETCGPLRHS